MLEEKVYSFKDKIKDGAIFVFISGFILLNAQGYRITNRLIDRDLSKQVIEREFRNPQNTIDNLFYYVSKPGREAAYILKNK